MSKGALRHGVYVPTALTRETHPDMPPSVPGIYHAARVYASWPDGPDDWPSTFTSTPRMARMSGYGVRTVRNALCWLSDHGYVDIRRRFSKSSKITFIKCPQAILKTRADQRENGTQRASTNRTAQGEKGENGTQRPPIDRVRERERHPGTYPPVSQCRSIGTQRPSTDLSLPISLYRSTDRARRRPGPDAIDMVPETREATPAEKRSTAEAVRHYHAREANNINRSKQGAGS